jgi:hypothetical protein
MAMPPSVQGGPAAGWYADPTGRYQSRYWDGSAWTDQVSAEDGNVCTDPVVKDGAVPDDPADRLVAELREALTTYSRLIEDFQAQRIDEAIFRREAFKVGLVVKGDNAWILDPVNLRWHHYDGFQLRTLELVDRRD